MKEVLLKKQCSKYWVDEYGDGKVTYQIPQINGIFEYEQHETQLGLIHKSYKDKESFDKNFKNPNFDLSRQDCLLVIEEEGPKLRFKIYSGFLHKRVKKNWFTQTKNVCFLTINRDTGDFYVGDILKYNKKKTRSKRIFRNCPSAISGFFTRVKNMINSIDDTDTQVYSDMKNILINKLNVQNYGLNESSIITKFYFDKKGIKYPNNFPIFFNVMYGKKFRTILRKGKNLVETTMIIKNLNGKKTKKFLHEAKNLNFSLLNFAKEMFGDDWLNQDNDIILQILNSNFYVMSGDYEQFKKLLSKEELRRVYFVFKNLLLQNEINVYSFYDHVDLYNQLKAYGETDLKWMSDGKCSKKFSDEHLDWSDKIEFYRRGYYTRIYPQYMIDEIEKDICGYFPKVLTDNLEYNEESQVQSNCVKTYIGKVGSLIISLRKDSVTSKDRATIQYVIKKEEEKIIANRIQTLGRFNQRLDESWDELLVQLDDRISSICLDQRFAPVKIQKECANGSVLSSDSFFDENGVLMWTLKKNYLNLKTEIW